jgi:uncharacterized membrane protein
MTDFLSDLTSRDYEVKIGDYFSRGWEIFKPFAWGFIVFTVVMAAISVVVGMLPSPLGNGGFGEDGSVGIISTLYNILVAPVLGVGSFFVAFQIARNRPYGFSDFFNGFKKYLPIFLTALVSGLLIFVGMILLLLPGIYLAVSYTFAQPLVIDKNLEFWSAMETSRKLITKKWFSFFGLLLLIGLLNIGGAILCGVGLLVTIPYSTCIVVAAYEDIVGLNSVADPAL